MPSFALLGWGMSLPVLYHLAIVLLRRYSPLPAPPTKESLLYHSGSVPDLPGSKLDSIQDPSVPATVDLSVVVPAYNEETRLNQGLADALSFLESRRATLSHEPHSSPSAPPPGSYEILIVDDGSRDQTFRVALQLSTQHFLSVPRPDQAQIRVIRLGRNRGKGGAVRHGILHSRGQRILFADADGASDFSELTKLLSKLDQISVTLPSSSPPTNTCKDKLSGVYGMTIGSRAHLVASELVVSRSKFRNFLMKGFHFYLYVLGLRDIRDTQCGFKLMTRDTARLLVSHLHVEGWIFDVELLLLGKLINPPIPIAEVPIRWTEIRGSKLSIIKDSLIMAIDMLIIRLNYTLGVWDIPKI